MLRCTGRKFKYTVKLPAEFTVKRRFHKLHRNGKQRRYGVPTENQNSTLKPEFKISLKDLKKSVDEQRSNEKLTSGKEHQKRLS